MTCPNCQTVAEPDSNFCEECGSQLQAIPAEKPRPQRREDLCECGAGPDKINEDGFCDVCGIQRRKSSQDHVELELSPLMAGVSDLGKRHFQNEDSFTLHQDKDFTIAVVCDGVSISQHPEQASRCAATTTKDALTASIQAANPDFKAEMRAAIAKASAAVKQIGFTPNEDDLDPPSSTIIAVLVIPSSGPAKSHKAVIGWLGDSRAYYFTASSSVILTKDHSWINETVDAGEMSYQDALRDKRAHRLTRTLGGYPEQPRAEMDEPGIIEAELAGTGWLILCTDGLWNYAAAPEDLAKLLNELPKTATALEISKFLTDWANKQGGKDNVTAVAIAV